MDMPKKDLIHLASFAARVGSGSACRSLFGGYTVWGRTALISGSTDLEAIDISEAVHPSLHSLQDAILVISRKPKSLSSSRGHATMEYHPFAQGRAEQAKRHLHGMFLALKEGDLERVGTLAEAEALSLHALLMSAPQGAILLEPSSLLAIQKIREARSFGLPVFFTLDAGPNVHLLYPAADHAIIEAFIGSELAPLCSEACWIADRCGEGPVKISEITCSPAFPL
jgi:diphosphomevalonate decarboxylase